MQRNIEPAENAAFVPAPELMTYFGMKFPSFFALRHRKSSDPGRPGVLRAAAESPMFESAGEDWLAWVPCGS